MEHRFVVALYILGTFVTAGGVVMAYFNACKQKRSFDKIIELNIELSREPRNFAKDFEQLLDSQDDEVANREEARAAANTHREAELEKALLDLGIPDGLPALADLSLPVAYWSKRSALADTMASFKRGGMVSLAGLFMLLIASVWSVYL